MVLLAALAANCGLTMKVTAGTTRTARHALARFARSRVLGARATRCGRNESEQHPRRRLDPNSASVGLAY